MTAHTVEGFLFILAVIILFVSAWVPAVGRASLVSIGLAVGFAAIGWSVWAT